MGTIVGKMMGLRRRWEMARSWWMGGPMAICAACTVRIGALRRSEKGQGTTEYAILVGVLVVIAILAITMFKPKIQELWDAIANGINSL